MTPFVRSPLCRCRLGVGRADITPPAGAYHRNWGAALHDRAEGVHRRLTASALVIEPESGGDAHVLFALDLGWLRHREMDALLARLGEDTGVAADRLVLTFSHTHAAINLDTERAGEPGGEHIAPYLEQLPDRLLEAYVGACAGLAPVELAFGAGRCALAMHRDAYDDERGLFVCGPNPDGPADDTLIVARATGERGGVVATLVNYACHPTTLAWDNRLISPDYVGALRGRVEGATGAPCVFLQGAAGDLGPARGFVGDPEVADGNGRLLGHSTLAALEALPPPGGRQWSYVGPVVSGATVGAWAWTDVDAERVAPQSRFASRTASLPLACRQLPPRSDLESGISEWSRRLRASQQAGDEAAVQEARARVERLRRALHQVEAAPLDGAVDYEIRLWRLGEGVVVLVGGEPYQQLQVELRRRFPRTALLVVELCNRSHSYLLPRERYGIGLYQEEVAVLAPGCLEAVTETIVRALDEWGLT